MGKLQWAKYIKTHKSGICVYITIPDLKNFNLSARLTVKNEKWPTAYAMLQEMLVNNLEGDWTARAIKNKIIHIVIKNASDLEKIRRILPEQNYKKQLFPTLCAENYAFEYSIKEFSMFSKTLGYIS